MASNGLQDIRIAVHSGDRAGLVRLLGGEVRRDALQLAGDAVAAAAAVQVAGAGPLASAWADALRVRDWDGDEELAAELDAALGREPAPSGTPLPVDLDELSELLETGLGADPGRVDVQTGEIWHASTIEYVTEEEQEDAPDFGDPDRWLYVSPEGSSEGYRDMAEFIATIDDAARADLLAVAIDGRGAFRRFKDTLARWPEESERWYRFSDERRLGRARQWLALAGYRVVPKPAAAAPMERDA